ncbi:MAG: glycerol-3-phosphate dehydrogenase [Chloroflexia bacterium]|nr:glycerol-3-phosphate dehydrogenase [Chloroflexia bacterium]
MTTHQETDLLVIGGGINGVGIARDAVGRGLSVVLCEQGDLAGATSSASSKLLHGGLRYLEQREFKLVSESLAEREVLLRNAPHIVKPLRFVLPHNPKVRPAWMLHAGLVIYDSVARDSSLPRSERFNLRSHTSGEPLIGKMRTGFAYSDCWVDDARLVLLTALDAHQRGATILTRTRCVSAERGQERWQVQLRHTQTGDEQTVSARMIVNAAGPWVGDVLTDALGVETPVRVRLIKGSHIVVPKLYDGDYAYVLQSDDRRIVFVLPFEKDFNLIGTTDIPFNDDPANVEITLREIDYLCKLVNGYFKESITREDVVWSFSGVRSLYDDDAASAASVSRDYRLELDGGDGKAAVLTVLGGKLTGYRLLSEHVMKRTQSIFPNLGPDWTEDAPLPGGMLQPAEFSMFVQHVQLKWSWLPEGLAESYARRYGSRVQELLGDAVSLEDLGGELSPGLYELEARFLVRNEWASTANDILWRRTKLGLHQCPDTHERLTAWLEHEGLLSTW